MKLFIPITQSQKARVIQLYAAPLDEWIALEEAAKLYWSPKHPNGILPQTLKEKCWKGKIPSYAFSYGPAGWFFHKPTLMGLRRIQSSFNNAA